MSFQVSVFSFQDRREERNAEIEYVREVLNGQIAEIDTKTILKDGSEYTGNYKLIFRAGGWRVYDVVVEDVSVVNNYRAEFERFSSKRSFDDLLQVLREKKSRLKLTRTISLVGRKRSWQEMKRPHRRLAHS